MLFSQDTPLDLMLRGFGRQQILDRTGQDVGYNGRRLREDAAGVDRHHYKLAHVRERVDGELIDGALELYAGGASKVDVLAHLGLAGENIVKLKVLFADLGLADQFSDADRRARKGSMARGMKQKYGVENPFELEEFQRKAEDTRQKKYGARYTLAEGSTLAEGARQSFAERMQDAAYAEDLRERKAAANMEKLGVRAPSQSPQVRARAMETTRERYGVDHWSQQEDAREAQRQRALTSGKEWAEKSRISSMERYGVPYHAQLPESRQRMSEWMRDPQNAERVHAARRAAGTFNTSEPERRLEAMLVAFFGRDDVQVQHRSRRYPFACDFYVASRDLFIELNGMWTHGGHWYDESDPEDRAKVRLWTSRGTAFYLNAVRNWTERDLRKREAAREHSLNYVVFWGSGALDEAALWLSLGAPDGRDWEAEHSWLPERELDLGTPFLAELDGRVRGATAIARAANWREFYRRELELWSADPRTAQGSLRGQLLANRFKHLGKAPDELSDLEILRGMGIAGLVRSYSVFDNTGMTAVLDEHEPASIYDPCAGWGERMVTAAARGIAYEGTDINPAVVAGHARIADRYGLMQQRTCVGDASTRDMTGAGHDMVFTCPPYGDVEIYTEYGAENLDHEQFLQWWAQVVGHSIAASTQVFAYQINQRLKGDMNQVLADAGWRLQRQIPVGHGRVHHFNRRKDGTSTKREFEEVQVFVRG